MKTILSSTFIKRNDALIYRSESNFSIFFILPVFQESIFSYKDGRDNEFRYPLICNSGVGDVDEIMEQCIPELLIKEFKKKNTIEQSI